MKPAEHELKTDHDVFTKTWTGNKPWELRKNDRNFKKGDTVILRETVHSAVEIAAGRLLDYSGREITGTILFVLSEGYNLPARYCIFTFMPTQYSVLDQYGDKIIL